MQVIIQINLRLMIFINFAEYLDVLIYFHIILLRYDWIEIRDGKNENDPLIGNRLCGSKRPFPIVSSGNTLFMHFHSDNRGSAKGFKVRPEISKAKIDLLMIKGKVK